MKAAITNKSLNDSGLYKGICFLITAQSKVGVPGWQVAFITVIQGPNSFLALAPSHCRTPESSAFSEFGEREKGKAQLHFKLLNLEMTLFTSAYVCLQRTQGSMFIQASQKM